MVIGVSNSKKLLEDILNKIQNKLGIVADVNLLTEDGLEYIEIVVNPWAFPVNYDGNTIIAEATDVICTATDICKNTLNFRIFQKCKNLFSSRKILERFP